MERIEAETVDTEQVKTDGWRADYEVTLNKLFSGGKIPTTKELADVIFEKGILDRVAPLSVEVRKQRLEKRKYVFDGERNDPKLYLRLLYANLAYREGLKMTAAFSWTEASGLAIIKMIEATIEKEGKCDSDAVFSQILDLLDTRFREEYEHYGGTNFDILPIGTRLNYHNIFCVVSGYNPSGTIRVDVDDEDGYRNLYKFTKGNGIDPNTLKDDGVIIMKPGKQ